MIRTHTYYVTRKEYYNLFLHNNNEKYKNPIVDNVVTRQHIRFT